jgi:hypothetical protein
MRRLCIVGQGLSVLALVWLSATATEKVALVGCGCAACGVIVVLAITWLRCADARGERLWPALSGAAVALAVVATVIATAWPLRLAYALSRPALQRLAVAVQAGQRPPADVRAGLFVIKQAELSRQGVVCLWTDLDPVGRTGFVQCRADSLPENRWSSIQLDEQWHLVSED